jgi:hypothetical protein
MNWLVFLSRLSLLITVAADLTVFFHVYPAFRRTGNKGFLLVALACILGIIDTICDHTIGLQHLEGSTYLAYQAVRRLAYFAGTILWATGIVQLTKLFLSHGPRPQTTDNAIA